MIGQTVSHYRVTEKLGAGGMGVVYKADDLKLERPVALKFLARRFTRDDTAKKRFMQEARAASALDHPNICNIHDIGETSDGQLYTCMAYYEGETLAERLRRGPLNAEDAIAIVRDVARGLAEAHRHGIVHRDIKPANLFITTDGTPKLLDFGVAKLKGQTQLTNPGRIPGTLTYMSPEQTKGAEVDGRSDVFSLGGVLYELLTGRAPFDAEHDTAIVYSIQNGTPEPLATHRRDLPKGLQMVIDRSLAKRPDDRYDTADDYAAGLDEILKEGKGRRMRRVLGFAVPTFVALAIAVLILGEPSLRQHIGRWFGERRIAGGTHIVVLPFENVGGQSSSQPFCDGVMETLTSKLTQLEQFHGELWVVPSSAVRERQVEGPAQARRAFGVNLAVAGSVQRMPDLVRVTLNLIDVSKNGTPRQIGSTVIDEDIGNITALQDEVVFRIAGMLNVELEELARSVVTTGGTAHAAAYDAYLMGLGYLQRYDKSDNVDHAVAALEDAVAQDPVYAHAYAALGEAYWRKYNATFDVTWIDKALESCTRAYELNDMLAPVHVTLGVIYRTTGRYDEAIAEFERALTLNPAASDAYRYLAGVYAKLQRHEEAEDTYRIAIDKKPGYWAGYDDLGIYYYTRGRYEDAIAQFDRVLELAPENPRACNRLGAVYYRMEDWDKAREMFERSAEIDPTYLAYSNLGVIEFVEGDYEASARYILKALALNDASHSTWGNLGNAYYFMEGRRNDALSAFKKAAEIAEEHLRMNPNDADVLATLAGYYVVLGEGGKGLTLLERAFALAPTDWWVLYCRGHAYEQLGQRDEAIEWIGKALEAGYPCKEVERDPWLTALRTDERYDNLVAAYRSNQKE